MKEVKLKWLVSQSNAGEVIDKSYWGQGGNILYTCSKEPMPSDYSDFPERKRTQVGDLLLTRNGAPYIHKPIPGSIYSNVVQRISVPSVNSDFLRYALQSRALNFRGYGVSIESLNYEMWGNLKIKIPDIKQQVIISSTIDRELSLIEDLITKKDRLIELLKEKRMATISHAVTKGIDPSASMKASGVDWLGDIPSH